MAIKQTEDKLVVEQIRSTSRTAKTDPYESALFSAVFVFQKSYTGNILGIGRNKFLKSYFSQKLPEIQRGDGEGPQATLTPGRRGPAPGRAPYV
jgi:hypothetical protein